MKTNDFGPISFYQFLGGSENSRLLILAITVDV
jgi:hypothetical protein